MTNTSYQHEGERLGAFIVKWLVEYNGYEEGTNTDYIKEYTVYEISSFRFLQSI